MMIILSMLGTRRKKSQRSRESSTVERDSRFLYSSFLLMVTADLLG